CLFLAGFDQLLMGYRDRSRMMDEQYKRDVTTNTGIVHPTVLLDGRIQAKWKKNGTKLTVTPFCKLSQKNRRRIARYAKELFSGEIREMDFQ
ncbi:MAG: winged helix DNA-binding domain-containing protein, partial [Synergistaceae bacterium]|nr:winged helix DNA-binding domain-containing protein [Synergistaceae bacterium]